VVQRGSGGTVSSAGGKRVGLVRRRCRGDENQRRKPKVGGRWERRGGRRAGGERRSRTRVRVFHFNKKKRGAIHQGTTTRDGNVAGSG
jgi:hypothetical protein